jgi:hypothetical protein
VNAHEQAIEAWRKRAVGEPMNRSEFRAWVDEAVAIMRSAPPAADAVAELRALVNATRIWRAKAVDALDRVDLELLRALDRIAALTKPRDSAESQSQEEA